MSAMPAGGERKFFDCGLRIADPGFLPWRANDIDFALAETKRGLDRFHQAGVIFFADRDAILNDLHADAEPFDFWFGIHAHNFVVDPHAQIALLLKKIEEIARLRFDRNRNPKGDENIVASALAQHLVGDRLCCFGSDFAAAARTKGVRDPWPKQFQIIVDLSHRPDG